MVCSDFGAQENKICHCFHFSSSICHEVVGLDAMILGFWMLSFNFFTPFFHSVSLYILVISTTSLHPFLFFFLSTFLCSSITIPTNCLRSSSNIIFFRATSKTDSTLKDNFIFQHTDVQIALNSHSCLLLYFLVVSCIWFVSETDCVSRSGCVFYLKRISSPLET